MSPYPFPPSAAKRSAPTVRRAWLAAPLALIAAASAIAVAPPAAAPPEPETVPTFSRDVASVLHRHCAPCHRPGQVAPFALLEYGDAAPRAEQIAFLTTRRVMPPWKPRHGYGGFRGERRLSEEEIAVLARWAEAGAPEGDPAAAPPPPDFPSGWQLGEPDLTATMPEPFALPAGGSDLFRNFVLPVQAPPDQAGRDLWVEAIELRTDPPHVLHHATILVDPNRRAREHDAASPGIGFDEGMLWAGEIAPPAGQFLAWTPGRQPRRGGEPWLLPAGADLVLEAHLLPHADEPVALTASIGLYLTGRPPERRPVMLRLGTEAIDIPAGEAGYRLRDRFVLPVDVEALSVYPHAHYLGSEVRAFATLPGGAREWLVWIDDWDFRWQDVYELEPRLPLPAGTAIEVEFAWDNSAANPSNPHRPPQRVRHGPRSSDEMGNLWMQVVPRDPGDAARLEEAVEMHYAGVVADGLRTRLLDAPGDAALHAELADLLARRGDLEPAAQHYRRTVEIDPTSAAAQNNLAAVLSRLGEWDQAVVHYREAARLEPAIASIRINLAGALIAVDRLDEAAAELREALRLAPGHPEALRRLALVLERLGKRESPPAG